MPDSSRLFFALWPDAETRQALAKLSKSLREQGLKPINPENLHVTLVFLGQVDADAELLITQSVAGIAAEPFVLTFDRLDYWSRPKIVCLTCQQPAPQAVMLAAALNSAVAGCGLPIDSRPYVPHITLSRHARSLPAIVFEPIVWRVGSFCLAESCREQAGVCYKVKQEWPFIKPAA